MLLDNCIILYYNECNTEQEAQMKLYSVIPHPTEQYVIVSEEVRARFYGDIQPVRSVMNHREAARLLKTLKTPKLDPHGDTTIKLYYHDGEYLTGYTVHGEAAHLLEKIGLAHYVDGWGYHVNDQAVAKLGTEFRYQAAVDLAAPVIAAHQDLQRAMEQAENDKFSQARQTGKPIVLRSYSDDCDDPREECSLDNVTEYAMPDGSTKTTRSHTW